eukprot:299705-Rhodomonas_salina.2
MSPRRSSSHCLNFPRTAGGQGCWFKLRHSLSLSLSLSECWQPSDGVGISQPTAVLRGPTQCTARPFDLRVLSTTTPQSDNSLFQRCSVLHLISEHSL